VAPVQTLVEQGSFCRLSAINAFPLPILRPGYSRVEAGSLDMVVIDIR
jgi:hypothetical protein